MTTSKEPKQSLIEFPCDFPIKIMGKSGDRFESAVLSIIHQHIPDLPEGAISINTSKGGNYTAITVTIRAVSQAQLDNIYRELTACEHVLMAL